MNRIFFGCDFDKCSTKGNFSSKEINLDEVVEILERDVTFRFFEKDRNIIPILERLTGFSFSVSNNPKIVFLTSGDMYVEVKIGEDNAISFHCHYLRN